MRKRSRKAPKTRDANQAAFDALQRLIERTEATGDKNPLAMALGRLGGLKGGKARAQKLTKAERSESARIAANARWAKKD